MSSYAWGPERESFNSQASYVTFNSVINNPGVGDERNFVRVRQMGAGLAWADSVMVTEGGRYEVYIYFRNDGVTGAEELRVQSYFAKYVKSGRPAEVKAGVYAKNARPRLVWDGAQFISTSDIPLRLSYIEGSAEIHTMGALNNSAVMGLFSDSGSLLGFDNFDGLLPGGLEYGGYITYEVEATKVAEGVEVNYSAIYGYELSEEKMSGAESDNTTTGTQNVIDDKTEAIPQTGSGAALPILSVGCGLLIMLALRFLLRKRQNCDKIKE